MSQAPPGLSRAPKADAGQQAIPTQRVEALELFGPVLRDALDQGRAEDAESLVRVHLEDMLELAEGRGAFGVRGSLSAICWADG